MLGDAFQRLPDAVVCIILSLFTTDFLVETCKLVNKRWNQLADQVTTFSMYRVPDSTLRRFISTRTVPLRDVRLWKSGSISPASIQQLAPQLRFLHCGYFPFGPIPEFPVTTAFNMLEVLSLHSWNIRQAPEVVPPLLRALILTDVTIDEKVLQEFVRRCHVLQTLVVMECEGVVNPTIESPTLERLELMLINSRIVPHLHRFEVETVAGGKAKLLTPRLNRLQVAYLDRADIHGVSTLETMVILSPGKFVFHAGLQSIKSLTLAMIYGEDVCKTWTAESTLSTLGCVAGRHVGDLKLFLWTRPDLVVPEPFELRPLFDALKNVESLTMREGFVECLGMSQIRNVPFKLPNLKTIQVVSRYDLHAVCFRGLRALAKRCPNLEKVNFHLPESKLREMRWNGLQQRLEQLQASVPNTLVGCHEVPFDEWNPDKDEYETAVDWNGIFESQPLY